MASDSLPPGQRVQKGKAAENEIVLCLNTFYGYSLTPSTRTQDCRDKIDCIFVKGDGTEGRAAVKSRESGRDLIVAWKEPYITKHAPYFTTPDDLEDLLEGTKIGRDMLGDIDLYICRSPDKKWIWCVDNRRKVEILTACIEEWKASGDKLHRGNPFRSRTYPVEVRYHIDKYSMLPKLLVFISPDAFDEPKGEIKKHMFKQVQEFAA